MFNAEEFVIRFGKENFKNFYYSHNNREVCEKFSLKKCQIDKVLDYLHLEKKTKEQVCSIISNTLLNKTEDEKVDIQTRKMHTCLEKYGCANPASSEEIRSKISDTINSMSDERKELKRKKISGYNLK